MSNHRVECPIQSVGGWHVDGNYHYTHELNFLQVFYYPQDTPIEMGPTQIVPGTHLVRNKARFMGHLASIKGAMPTTAPAGSIFLTVYHIWHRRGSSTASGIRNLLKYFYWRTTPPQRDWVTEPDFDFATAEYALVLAERMWSSSATQSRCRRCSYGSVVATSRSRIWVGKAGPCPQIGMTSLTASPQDSLNRNLLSCKINQYN